MTEIVVGVDGSDDAARALAWALEEADLHGWSLTAAMAWSWLDQHQLEADAPFDPGYGQAPAVAALDGYLVRALGEAAAERVGRRVVCDLPAAALIEASVDARLLVVGARGLGGFRRLLLGSVSDHCLHHTHVPIAIIRPHPADAAPSGPRRVVVGVDGSPASDRALAWSVQEAVARHAALEVVHGWELPAVAEAVAFDVGLLEEGARTVLERATAQVDDARLDQAVSSVLRCGHPVSSLLEAAEGAELVVVGARGRGGFAGLLLGSVSSQLAHHVKAPLIVVRAGGTG
jgi:nucleotide-binding universal stress UspA family protein